MTQDNTTHKLIIYDSYFVNDIIKSIKHEMTLTQEEAEVIIQSSTKIELLEILKRDESSFVIENDEGTSVYIRQAKSTQELKEELAEYMIQYARNKRIQAILPTDKEHKEL